MPSHAIRLFVLLLTAGLALPAGAQAASSQRATVVSVLDGDTVRVKIGRRTGTIDLIGIKAPTGKSCFAREARTALRKLLPTRSAISVLDETRVRGRGRYVTRNGKLINTEMLRKGNARLGSLTKVRRASALRAAERSGRRGKRGLHKACAAPKLPATTEPAATPDTQPGPVPQAVAVRTALAGGTLTELFTDNQRSERNDTRFCADGRTERREELIQNGRDQPLIVDIKGSWAVLDTQAAPDGSITAQVVVRSDDPVFDPRILNLVLGADGKVRSPRFNASEVQPDARPCAAPAAGAPVQNDTPAARDGLVAAVSGARLEAAGRQTDVCPGPRLVRRENGIVVADGTLGVEWAISDGTTRLGVMQVSDATRGTSRRVIVQIDAAGAIQIQELGRDGAAAVPATRSAASC